MSVVPVASGRTVLAFDEGRGLADLELASQERLRNAKVKDTPRLKLEGLQQQIRHWRHSRIFRFTTRSIILVERVNRRRRTRRPSS